MKITIKSDGRADHTEIYNEETGERLRGVQRLLLDGSVDSGVLKATLVISHVGVEQVAAYVDNIIYMNSTKEAKDKVNQLIQDNVYDYELVKKLMEIQSLL
jgi:hypothetical protein